MAMEHDAAAPHILKLARSLFPQQRTFSFTAISVAKGQKTTSTRRCQHPFDTRPALPPKGQ